ncbi:MAG TPA: hypothetical protein VMV44_12815 [Rectinemataceae bacterium]|nr:hypothetical protein [Rectinemataceae bacterium]
MEIIIALDSYDDLFSDFDIRDYGERALSWDLLDELHVRLRRTRKLSELEIVFILPSALRRADHELLIVERMRSFFDERRDNYFREDRKAKRLSLLYLAIGLVLSIGANLVVERFSFLPLFGDFVLIPSWFFVWSGFDLLITNRKEISRKRKYYEALSTSRTRFRNLEDFGPQMAAAPLVSATPPTATPQPGDPR